MPTSKAPKAKHAVSKIAIESTLVIQCAVRTYLAQKEKKKRSELATTKTKISKICIFTFFKTFCRITLSKENKYSK